MLLQVLQKPLLPLILVLVSLPCSFHPCAAPGPTETPSASNTGSCLYRLRFVFVGVNCHHLLLEIELLPLLTSVAGGYESSAFVIGGYKSSS